MFSSGYRRFAPPVVKNLIILNIIMYVATLLMGDVMYRLFSLFYVESEFFRPYQFITHMFMHGGFFHIFFNMYTLWIFGSVLENVWGSKKFFIYYMVTGLGAAALHELVMYLQVLGNPAAMATLMYVPTVGASGAIYGLLLGYGMLFPNNVMQLIFPPVAMKAKWFVLVFGGIELFMGLTGSGGNVAHFAHLGGMIFGFLLILYWKKRNRLYY